MTEAQLLSLVTEWDSFPSGDENATGKYHAILDRLQWFSREWSEYIPAGNMNFAPNYMSRLAHWISNADTEGEQKLLLEYALHISYFSHSDFTALYHSAFLGPITRWVVEEAGINLMDRDLDTKANDELHKKTWYCPITDSLKINDFYHANNIVGIGRRPLFYEYFCIDRASPTPKTLVDTIKAYMDRKRLERLVLLEDFVGSGNQVRDTLLWTLSNFSCAVLFVPLIICPPGVEMTSELERNFPGRFSSRPVVRLKPHDLLGASRQGQVFGGRAGLAEQLESLALSTYPKVAGPTFNDATKAPYSPMGYREGGCSVVMFSNTPDNTLPIVHHRPDGDTWTPLFPRSSRLE